MCKTACAYSSESAVMKNKKRSSLERKHVTNAVLSVYRRVNPSHVRLKSWKEYFSIWSRFISEKLLLPPVAFENARLMDVGCGTGEKSLVYAWLGANVMGCDANNEAIRIARENAKKIVIEDKISFHVCNVFEITGRQKFDIVVSDGMLHHTSAPWAALDCVTKIVKPGGIIILGLAEPCGFFQRRLQRWLVKRIAGNNEKKIISVAKKLFGRSLVRASKASGRTIESTIYDSFINPQVVTMPLNDIRRHFEKNKIHLDTTWPRIELPLQTDSQYHNLLSNDEPSTCYWEDLNRLMWLLKKDYDFDTFRKHCRKFSVNKILSCLIDSITDDSLQTSSLEKVVKMTHSSIKVSTEVIPYYDPLKDLQYFVDELLALVRLLSEKESQGESLNKIVSSIKFKRLFKGFNGVGMVYYRGTKSLS